MQEEKETKNIILLNEEETEDTRANGNSEIIVINKDKDNINYLNFSNHIKSFLNELIQDNEILKQINLDYNNIQDDELYLIKDYNIKGSTALDSNINFTQNNPINTEKSAIEGNNTKIEYLSKKRGRTKIGKSKHKKEHSKFEKDNVIRKIQVNYISFLVKFINYKIKKHISVSHPLFKNLSYEYKKNITKSFFNELKTKTIGEVLQNKATKKQNNDNNLLLANKKTFDSVYKKSAVLKRFLNMNYLDFMQNIYSYSAFHESKNFRKELQIPKKIRLFEDLLQKEVENDPENGEMYVQKMKEILKNEYVKKPKALFKITIKKH